MNQEQQDIRWKQRYSSFQDTLSHLQEACQRLNPDWLIAAGLIQTFEFTFELSWKTLKDLMAVRGEITKFPRDVIHSASAAEFLNDEDLWIEMLDKRDELSHVYNEEQAFAAVKLIKTLYLPELIKLCALLKTQL